MSIINVLNIVNVNAYIINTQNFYNKNKNNEKLMSRLQFILLLSLHKELTNEWQQHRLNFPKISKELRTNIQALIEEKKVPSNEKSQHGPQNYCNYCSYKKLTTKYCIECQRPICGEHKKKVFRML